MVRPMNGSTGYAASFQRHFAAQLPKVLLETLGAEADDDWTVGEILEAAEAVGVADALTSRTMEELALAFVDTAAPAASAPAPVSNDRQPARKRPSVHSKARKLARGADPRAATATATATEGATERLSLEAAADLILPIVRERGQAAMLDIEAATGMGRRKVRFHVGRLVKHGLLVRHGMGRGTYYTAAD